MEYIDFSTGSHTAEEHYKVVEQLRKSGFRFTHSAYGNPHFYNENTKESVCIISSISDGSIYFTP